MANMREKVWQEQTAGRISRRELCLTLGSGGLSSKGGGDLGELGSLGQARLHSQPFYPRKDVQRQHLCFLVEAPSPASSRG